MKIAILLPDLRGGGVERVRLILAEEFCRLGHEVEFILLQAQGELLEEATSRYAVVDLKVSKIRNLPIALFKYLNNNPPDALLSAMWPITGIAALVTKFIKHPVRHVASEHVDFRMTGSHKSIEKLILKYFGKWIYGNCHNIVAVSKGVADSLSQVVEVDKSKVNVIFNPIRQLNIQELPASEKQLLRKWIEGDFQLIAIGSMKEQKGFDVLLRAIADLQKSIDVRLLILGSGTLRNELELLAQELALENKILMPGFRADIGSYLVMADVFVLSSKWEGLGNVITEALSTGTPVVSTDCPSGPSEILNNGEFGRLVPVDDPVALANAIKKTLKSKSEPEKLKKRAAQFSAESQATLYLQLLTRS